MKSIELSADQYRLFWESLPDSAYLQPSTLDGDPFIIIDGGKSVEIANDTLRSVLTAEQLQDVPAYGDLIDHALEWGYSDEYSSCSNCGAAIETNPSHMWWKPQYHLTDGAIYCKECVDPLEYIQDCARENESINEYFVDPGETDPPFALIADMNLYGWEETKTAMRKLRRILPYLILAYDDSSSPCKLWARATDDLIEENPDYGDLNTIAALVRVTLINRLQIGIDLYQYLGIENWTAERLRTAGKFLFIPAAENSRA